MYVCLSSKDSGFKIFLFWYVTILKVHCDAPLVKIYLEVHCNFLRFHATESQQSLTLSIITSTGAARTANKQINKQTRATIQICNFLSSSSEVHFTHSRDIKGVEASTACGCWLPGLPGLPPLQLPQSASRWRGGWRSGGEARGGGGRLRSSSGSCKTGYGLFVMPCQCQCSICT